MLSRPHLVCALAAAGAALMVMLLVASVPSYAATVRPMVIDFSTDENGNALVNGQAIAATPYFGDFVAISSSGTTHLGPVIFDSDPQGPNTTGRDPDLLIGQGNILILQHPKVGAQRAPGIFKEPNDADLGGVLIFDFMVPDVRLSSIDLVDMDGNGAADVRLTDGAGKTRTYFIPKHWTRDLFTEGPLGYSTLDFTILEPQRGEGDVWATAREDSGFDPGDVRRLELMFTGSAAVDNLRITPGRIIPEPSSATLYVMGLFAVCRRCCRRRRSG